MLPLLLGTAYTLGGAFTIGLMYYRATIMGYRLWEELGPLPFFAMVLWPVALPVMAAVVVAKNMAQRHIAREQAKLLEEAEVNATLKQIGVEL